MREMDLRVPGAIGVDFIWLQIHGYMGWPHDDKERSARIARYFLRQLAAVGSDQFTVKIPMPMTYDLRTATPELRRELFASTRRACFNALDEFDSWQALLLASGNEPFPVREVVTTGFVMLLIRLIDSLYPELGVASIRKAVFLIEDIARSHKGGVLIKNEREIRKACAKFRDIAHLAAASVFLVCTEKNVGTLETAQNVPIFLTIAQNFGNFGKSFFPHAQKSTLLNRETMWSVPKNMLLPDPGGAFTIRLEQKDLTLLQSYKA